jgi:uncharacterized protein (DUF2267 family)
MDYDKFIQEVKTRAHIENTDAAERTIKAVLKTLSEHLARHQAEHIKAQLPGEISKYIISREEGERFSVDEFLERVADREKDVILDAAMHHSRAVIEVLCDAINESEVYDLKSQLPPDFETLFAAVHK